MKRQPENQKDIDTSGERPEKTSKGEERQVREAESKDKVTGAW